ncbi:MAG: hypothetical protein WGN25_00975 [Candidatus Electrothrix sp. GW3-4]|uniref:hypothetical protein n=1 Tax=Candidatus Electrothrix sp. GW3-4 TaxID=3126740 RepID=UPI0030D42D8D
MSGYDEGDIADRIQMNGGTNMDFITSAIASAVGSLGLEGVKHGYTKLKELLQGKFGEKSALAEAVEQLENNPDSPARKAVVAEELAKVGADKDEEVLTAARQLKEKLKGAQAVQGGVAVGGDVHGDVYAHSGNGDMNIAQGEGAIGKQVNQLPDDKRRRDEEEEK